MKVLVDLLFFTGLRGGMESYVQNLYSRMPTVGFEYVALGSREFAALDTSWFPGEVIDSGISGDDRTAWARGEVSAVGRAAKKVGADLIHSPANIGPWTSRVPVVLTVQDLLPFVHPEFVPGPYAPVLRTLIKRAAKNAARILTISDATRRDIIQVLAIPTERIEVIPLAGSDVSSSTISRDTNLLLAVGNRMPHKNFDGLLRALALVPKQDRPTLVITGGQHPDPLSSLVAELDLDASVLLEGWLPRRQLEGLYSRATAVVVPTRFEGFGLPVLEAMAHGAPVLCSDLPVLREVAGDAAVYFDPENPASIAAAITDTIGNPALRDALAASGLDHAATYSWQRTADQTAAAFQGLFDQSA